MSEPMWKSPRSIELPLGCKDLSDVSQMGNWEPSATPSNWPKRTEDKLAYSEGYLARLFTSVSKGAIVSISRFQDHGSVTMIPDAELGALFVAVSWNGATQERAVRAVFEEEGISPVERADRWKPHKRGLRYALPAEPVVAAKFIGKLFRDGYGLGDLSRVVFWYHESNAP